MSGVHGNGGGWLGDEASQPDVLVPRRKLDQLMEAARPDLAKQALERVTPAEWAASQAASDAAVLKRAGFNALSVQVNTANLCRNKMGVQEAQALLDGMRAKLVAGGVVAELVLQYEVMGYAMVGLIAGIYKVVEV